MSDWISVEDRLPLLNERVWVYTSDKKQWAAKRINGRGVYLVDGLAYIENVTHWQQLPTPPED